MTSALMIVLKGVVHHHAPQNAVKLVQEVQLNSGKPTPRDYKKFPPIKRLLKESYAVSSIDGLAKLMVAGFAVLGIASAVEPTIWVLPMYKISLMAVATVGLLLWCVLVVFFIFRNVNVPKILGSHAKFTVSAVSMRDESGINLIAYSATTGLVQAWSHLNLPNNTNLPNVALQDLNTKKIFAITVADWQIEQFSQHLVEQTVVDGKIFWLWASVT